MTISKCNECKHQFEWKKFINLYGLINHREELFNAVIVEPSTTLGSFLISSCVTVNLKWQVYGRMNFNKKIGVVIIKKSHKIFIVLSAVVLFAGIRLFITNQEEGVIKDNTFSYLEERGYDTDNDIEAISIADIGEDEEMNAVVVTFKDEPQVDYFYTYEKGTKQIIQIDSVNKGSKQSLKHKES